MRRSIYVIIFNHFENFLKNKEILLCTSIDFDSKFNLIKINFEGIYDKNESKKSKSDASF